jgi:hypothetical protein
MYTKAFSSVRVRLLGEPANNEDALRRRRADFAQREEAETLKLLDHLLPRLHHT